MDESLAEAHSGLAILKTWGEWDWPAAERAIELNPNHGEARAYYAHFLNIMGRPDEAMAQIERALELDPFNALYQALYGEDLFWWRRYDDAIAQFRKALTTSPNLPVALVGISQALHLKGMYEEALTAHKLFLARVGDRESEEALIQGYAEGGYPRAIQGPCELRICISEPGRTRVPSIGWREASTRVSPRWRISV